MNILSEKPVPCGSPATKAHPPRVTSHKSPSPRVTSHNSTPAGHQPQKPVPAGHQPQKHPPRVTSHKSTPCGSPATKARPRGHQPQLTQRCIKVTHLLIHVYFPYIVAFYTNTLQRFDTRKRNITLP